MSKLKLPTAVFALLLALPPSLSSASIDSSSATPGDEDEINQMVDQFSDIYGGRRDGYDTAYCPSGYRVQYCEFDHNTCDNTSQGSNYCSADSRNHQVCRFHGRCVRPVRHVRIRGGIQDGYDTAYCPNGYRIQSCSFDRNTCDNLSQGYDYCSADSRNHRRCQFTGDCVSH